MGPNRPEVIVMELCNAGNLYSMSEEPQNHYGFEEEEFKIMLSDISEFCISLSLCLKGGYIFVEVNYNFYNNTFNYHLLFAGFRVENDYFGISYVVQLVLYEKHKVKW